MQRERHMTLELFYVNPIGNVQVRGVSSHPVADDRR